MAYSNNDDDIFDEIYEEFREESRRQQEPRAQTSKRVRIRWGSVAIFAMIIVLAALLIFLINNFKDEVESRPKVPATTSDSSGAIAVGGEVSSPDDGSEADISQSEESEPESLPEEPPKPLYPVDAEMTVIDGATYFNGILIVNKTYGLPEDFDPGVNPVAEAKLQEMYSAAAADGLTLWTASGYRTYEYQKNLYEKYAKRDGYEAADTYSARPGHSEHETGLTFDVNDPSSDFDGTAEAQWLKEHCAEYGFIIRYPEGKEDITGFMYESWHVRYVGEEVARFIMENDICLEEYFGITSVYADAAVDN